MIRVLVAEDQHLVRQGIRALLEKAEDIEVVGEAKDGREAVEMAEYLNPDVVVIDLAMPRMNGNLATERIRALRLNCQVVILSMYSDEKLVRQALRSGAKGYLSKHSVTEELLLAVRAARRGETFLSSVVSGNLLANVFTQPEFNECRRKTVFICYSHKDREVLRSLQTVLRPVERAGSLVLWDDTKIKPGSKWREEIREAIDSARVAVLLISPEFLDSEFINSHELPPLLARAEKDGARILPVIVRTCLYEEVPELSQFQSVNPPSSPVLAMSRAARDAFYVQLAREILRALESEEDRFERLSAREKQVLKLVAEGRTNNAIARVMGVSVKIVEKHRSSLMAKLNVDDMAGLIRTAMKHGLIFMDE